MADVLPLFPAYLISYEGYGVFCGGVEMEKGPFSLNCCFLTPYGVALERSFRTE